MRDEAGAGMTTPPIIGLHGVAGAGKDTTYVRLRELGGSRFLRYSIADPMKESIAALFDVSLEHLERIKRDEHARVELYWSAPHAGMAIPKKMSVREFMQRYGTEAHRGIFGEDFWLDFWMQRVRNMHAVDSHVDRTSAEWVEPKNGPIVVVNTSVRFPNEARAILEHGGEIWQIVGPQDYGAAGHESETPLPPALVTRYIDNSFRDGTEVQRGDGSDRHLLIPDYSHLDDQVALILSQWKEA